MTECACVCVRVCVCVCVCVCVRERGAGAPLSSESFTGESEKRTSWKAPSRPASNVAGISTYSDAGVSVTFATAVAVGMTSMPTESYDLRFDHPFMVVIEGQGTILFMGRVAQP